MTQIAADDSAIEKFAGLNLNSIALLLDVDGTLIDIGPTPQQVQVPKDLRAALELANELTGAALALVSGRLISDLDRLFSPLVLSAIGAHGAEMRVAGAMISCGVMPLPEALRHRLSNVATSGVLVEDKGYSLALHYRRVPECAAELSRKVTDAVAAFAGEALEILPGKEMLEVKRSQINKGNAVRALMNRSPFAGRQPVFIGDDVTDESVFAALPGLDGKGFSVGRPFHGLAGQFKSPTEVREALLQLARRGHKVRA